MYSFLKAFLVLMKLLIEIDFNYTHPQY